MNEFTQNERELASAESKGLSADTRAMLAYEASKKSVGVAYLLWFFFGGLGVHRFYLGRTGSGMAMLALFVLSAIFSLIYVGIFGFILLGIWALVDAFLIPGIARQYNQTLVLRIQGG